MAPRARVTADKISGLLAISTKWGQDGPGLKAGQVALLPGFLTAASVPVRHVIACDHRLILEVRLHRGNFRRRNCRQSGIPFFGQRAGSGIDIQTGAETARLDVLAVAHIFVHGLDDKGRGADIEADFDDMEGLLVQALGEVEILKLLRPHRVEAAQGLKMGCPLDMDMEARVPGRNIFEDAHGCRYSIAQYGLSLP